MSLPLSSLLLLLLLVAGGECLRATTLFQSKDKLESGSCSAGKDQYCCYNKKCSGTGQYVNKTIKCDQKSHYCTVNTTTGYPGCKKDEDGGDYTLCRILQKSIWSTCGCDYDGQGKVTICDCWFGPLFYIVIVLVVVSLVGGVAWRIRRYIRLRDVERLA